jgi:hypothetical protein
MERRTGEGGEEGRHAQEEARARLGAHRVEGGEGGEGALGHQRGSYSYSNLKVQGKLFVFVFVKHMISIE